MKFNSIRNQKGLSLTDLIYWGLALAILAFAARYFIQHPEDFHSRSETHSPLEDTHP